MYYNGTAYSEYFLRPQVHPTSQGDVLPSPYSGQAVPWAVGLQIICLLDGYPFNYLVNENHMIFGGFRGVPLAQEHVQNVHRMRFLAATVPFSKFSMWLSKTLFEGHLGHALVQGELHWSLQKLYGSHWLDDWKDMHFVSILFEGLQPAALPAYYGCLREHLPGLWDGPEDLEHLLVQQLFYSSDSSKTCHILNFDQQMGYCNILKTRSPLDLQCDHDALIFK